ncbi:inactive protein kinase SELMODRAFT_444075-like [Triticum dicoccoides]|uniref:inactive protein kinase SELMODRAFT_444075-like n=1 Tax=Triticum dicoccoides TaxID=85692 RepID=UPI00189194F5|nr:inactive protein kinase SELMODRAFT_444075-like [Triticum dicoccoides]
MLGNGTLAVKKLIEMVDIDEKKFSEEVRCLMKAKHKNIVRFLGYCCDTQGEMLDCEGKLVLAEVRQRCFDEKQSQTIASKLIGTMGYVAPEFYARRNITFKLDIYSLGMIITEILTGEKGYADIDNVRRVRTNMKADFKITELHYFV